MVDTLLGEVLVRLGDPRVQKHRFLVRLWLRDEAGASPYQLRIVPDDDRMTGLYGNCRHLGFFGAADSEASVRRWLLAQYI